MKYLVLEENDRERFEQKLNDAALKGGRVISSSCGFVDSALYDYCNNYQAIIELNDN